MEFHMNANKEYSILQIENSNKWKVPSFQNIELDENYELIELDAMEIETEQDHEEFLSAEDSYLSNEKEESKYYFVEKIMNSCLVEQDPDYLNCNLYCDECNACAHLYRCTCHENAIRNNMCKHIHTVCKFNSCDHQFSNRAIDLQMNYEIVEQTKELTYEDTSLDLFNELSCDMENENQPIPDELDCELENENEITSDKLGYENAGQSRTVLEMKEKIKAKFLKTLDMANSPEQLKLIEDMIKPLEPYLKSMPSASSNFSMPLKKNDIKKTSTKVQKQYRIFERTTSKKNENRKKN